MIKLIFQQQKHDEFLVKDVKKWLKENETHPQIVKAIGGFNGELMVKLDELIRADPNYFLNKLKNENIDLYSLIKFMNDFEKLFH